MAQLSTFLLEGSKILKIILATQSPGALTYCSLPLVDTMILCRYFPIVSVLKSLEAKTVNEKPTAVSPLVGSTEHIVYLSTISQS